MTVVLTAVAVLLALWGFYSFTIFENVAAVDISSRIIVGAAIVLGLAAVVRALDRLRRDLVQAAGLPRDHSALEAPRLDTSTEKASAPIVEAEPTAERIERTPVPTPPVSPPLVAPRPETNATSTRTDAEPKVRSPFAPPATDLNERPVPDFLTRTAPAVAIAATAAAGGMAIKTPAATPASASAPEPEAAEPTLLREGLLNGVNYRFYSDGSVEAEGEDGPQRYSSVAVLRDEILSRRGPVQEQDSALDDSGPTAQDRQEAPETLSARPFEPLVSNHVGSDDLNTSPAEAGESDIPVIRASRTYGISDDSHIEPSVGEFDRGLQHTDMSFEPAEDDLAPPIDVSFEDALEEDGLFYSREGELGYDEPVVEQQAPEKGDRWSEAIRMLLRRDRGDTGGDGNIDKEAGGFDDPIDIGDRRR